MSTLAVYPGSFDPLTNGHVDIILRGARLFDRIIVAILVNAEKAPLFTMAERVDVARAVFKDTRSVEVDTFEGLLVDYVGRRGCVVRGKSRRGTAPSASTNPASTNPASTKHSDDLMSTLAVYPGSFDPLTNGHVDIILRGARLFDRIIVAILVNAEKSPLFSMEERVDIARSVFKDHANVEVDTFDGLLVDYVERREAQVIVRGLRAVSDFEFEFQMALMNQRLNSRIETVFMMPAEQYTYISSRLIKEVFKLGGRVNGLVPELVEQRLREKV